MGNEVETLDSNQPYDILDDSELLEDIVKYIEEDEKDDRQD